MKARDLARRVVEETEDRFWIPVENDYDPLKRLALISIGVNDSWLRARDERHVTSLAAFSDYIAYIARVLAEKCQVLYVGLLPCDEAQCSHFWNTLTPPQTESRLEYEAVAIRRFQDIGALTVPLAALAHRSEEYMESIGEDGVHPRETGERWIYQQVVPHFDELIGWFPRKSSNPL